VSVSIMTKGEITAKCKKVKFPSPKFSPTEAVIRIPIVPVVRMRKPEKMTGEEFDTWCGEASHAAVSRFINHHLKTRYSLQDVYAMRRRDKHISSRIRLLVRKHSQPTDPKRRN